ncbi:endonuclease/exonuclease/phosphatase family protein [Maribellus sp. CM-23]|uniref:endonuclease/exonuclease/phosphatase family protein n=1 Tax=Maribellus sp. CM-23 TaxID=2781026 RepID=UPI001F1FC219|nr:endonuclease/exonuclease/phosphatase family protein [Maribellus sp. CM-23]MCE4565293.1 endonuclease/exonuclease/phosphatase family protein [Maribellus sp. CM-23]
MKIVTWNCNGAFRNKFENIIDYNADIYIIQECENPIESQHKKYKEWACNYHWIGDSKNRGLAIFARPDIDLKKLDWSNKYRDHYVKHFLPCTVNNEFDLLAVWTHQNNSPNFGYIGQLWKYLQINKNNLNHTIIAGDFNSNKIWDQWDRWWNHSDVVEELDGIGIESLYHKFMDEQQGEETSHTLYFQRKLEKTYHIDYIFGSQEFCKRLKCLEVGQVDKWLAISDHMPLVCYFE